MTRDELRGRASELRAQGLSYKAIARELGLPPTTVFSWLNPVYAERARMMSRAAKARRTGTCVDCGAPTRYAGHGGAVAVAARCPACSSRRTGEARRVWTPAAIADAIRWWAAEFGAPPAAPDWDGWNSRYRLHDPKRADRYERLHAEGRIPSAAHVADVFGSWNAAIAAAGFTPRPRGGRQ